MKKRPIGVFDSGVGGLAITRVLKEDFKNEDFIYIADLKNVPYGPKLKEEIRSYVVNITNHLVKEGVQAIVIACNTASTEADDLGIDIPIITMIDPTVEETLLANKNNNVLLIATERTVKSKVYEEPLISKGINLYKKAMPEFVLLVEDLQIDTKKSHQVVKKKLKEFKDKDIGTIILGCTHFGFLEKEIKKEFPNAKLVSGAKMVSKRLEEVIDKNEDKELGTLNLFTTKELEEFKRKADYLNISYDSIKEIKIEGEVENE